MKKRIFGLFVILSLIGGMAYAYDADGNVNVKREIAGAPASVAYREYQLVRFAENGANGVQLSAGDVVVGDCVSDDGITVAIVGTTNSADAVRGVVVSSTIPTCDVTGTTAATDFGRRNWGYIQVRGLCTKCNIDGTGVAAGASMTASQTSRYATNPKAGAIGPKVMGFAYSTSANGNSNTVDINI